MVSTKKYKYRAPKFQIIKSTGNIEHFNKSKLQRSLQRTGLLGTVCKDITDQVACKIHHGSTTRDIFKHAEKILRHKSTVAAVHYSLKKSLLKLGPTGYEFESFVAKYFEVLGFNTQVGITLQGKFVRHEVDVVASKPKVHVYVECKFHNNSGRKNDIKVVLYVKSRWDDLKKGPEGKLLKSFYIATNTAFTTDAIEYANGVGLELLGINAPAHLSFLDQIKKYKLFPITSLIKLKKIYYEELFKKNIILCSELLNESELLLSLGMKEEEIESLFKDIEKIINH